MRSSSFDDDISLTQRRSLAADYAFKTATSPPLIPDPAFHRLHPYRVSTAPPESTKSLSEGRLQMGRSEKNAELSVKSGKRSTGSRPSISSAPVPAHDSRKTGLRIRSASLINTRNSVVVDKENGDCTPALKKVSAVSEEAAVMQHQPVDKSSSSEAAAGQLMRKRSSKASANDSEYYKILAEERKNALKETLAENEVLHEEVEMAKTEAEMLRAEKDQLQEQNEMLTAENEQLQRLLEQAAERGFTLI